MKSFHDTRVSPPAASNKELGLGERPPAIVKRTHGESPGGELFGIIA